MMMIKVSSNMIWRLKAKSQRPKLEEQDPKSSLFIHFYAD